MAAFPAERGRGYPEAPPIKSTADVTLTADGVAWLDENVGAPAGDRYADMSGVNR